MKKSNRVIKFRAWNGESMIYNVIIGTNSVLKKYSSDTDLMGIEAFHEIEDRRLLHRDVMQYTGLKDKNGLTEIYEGDILNFGNYSDNKKPCNFEITFNNGCFMMRELRSFGGDDLSLIDEKAGEVVGNIYETKSEIS